ncbi:MAG: hypothetical protein AAGI88_21700 [Pseudomonadota bacterium]
MILLYLAASVFLGYQTVWWIGATGFFLSWVLSFGIGIYLISQFDGDAEKLNEKAATKHVLLLGSLLMAAMFL